MLKAQNTKLVHASTTASIFVVRHVGKARLDKVERVESSQVEFGPLLTNRTANYLISKNQATTSKNWRR